MTFDGTLPEETEKLFAQPAPTEAIMSPAFINPQMALLLERRPNGYTLVKYPGTTYELRTDLTDMQYTELKEQMALISQAPQPAPTGNGRIVLPTAIACAAAALDLPEFDWLTMELIKRTGSTTLRVDNERDALRDALDAALGGYMSATQLRIETDSADAEELQRCFLEAAQLCKAMMDRR